ncbi:hypothetical protein OP10G_3281 [Fimbriimonas ginsengisoli Gsoil 348]|uniref:Uncharacterized protein n=1 Tax=Fimbriimonas ginsengisoli Gsoil 348 TaxID=661478 RepID=A0A068NY52_FIMGI|nr:hypothetical protein OP10G_3281 [Fimbriimonas ginsengisoli Gsoil 348]
MGFRIVGYEGENRDALGKTGGNDDLGMAAGAQKNDGSHLSDCTFRNLRVRRGDCRNLLKAV